MTPAAGIAFVTPTGHALFLKRAKGDHQGTWCFPGGSTEGDESAEETALREAHEETGYIGNLAGMHPIANTSMASGASYTTFRHPVEDFFAPDLDDEQSGYAWAPVRDPPQPLHPGVEDVLGKVSGGEDALRALVADIDALDAEFNESDHPRDPAGKFGSGSGGSSAGKPAPVPGAGGAAAAASAPAPLNPAKMKKVGAQMGSNPGGVYESEGKRYYVKAARSVEHARNEILAGALYNLAGARTFKYAPVEGGKHVATEMEPLTKKNAKEFSPQELTEARQDFAIHAWLANWDAAGLDYDNLATIGGKPVNTDLGGALAYRARGEPKGSAFGNAVGEWGTLRDPKINPQNAKVFGPMTPQELKQSAERVTSIPDEKMRATVLAGGGGADMADKLIARKADIARKAGLAADAMDGFAFDHALLGDASIARVVYAFDRESVRSFDEEGRLHVSVTPISKAAVNPYVGHEIPKWGELGLDPNKVYQLLRHPEELERAAPSFNGVQVLRKHIPVAADDHQPWDVVGATGTDCEYEHPYLRNSLVIWSKDDIDAIERDEKKELSSAYRYDADMTPGEYEGEHYDGVMRNIRGNHVAIVKEGRAGSDVVVGDSAEEINAMATTTKPIKLSMRGAVALGAIRAVLRPALAKDAKPSLAPIFAGNTDKNFHESKQAIVAAVTKVAKPLLAKDATIPELAELLDVLEAHPDAIDAEPQQTVEGSLTAGDPGEVKIMPAGGGYDAEPLKGFLKGKMSEDDFNEAVKLMPGAQDEPAERKEMAERIKEKEKSKDAAMDQDDDDDDEKKKGGGEVTKDEMNKTIAATIAAERKRASDMRDAERTARPYIGNLVIACDSAEGVFRAALDSLGIEHKGIHPSALETILKMQPVPGAKKQRGEPLAQDAAATKSFAERYPEAARIGIL